MTILRTYYAKDETTEALRDAATLIAGSLGQGQPIRDIRIGDEVMMSGGGFCYRDHNIMIEARPESLTISMIREKGARCIVAYFSFAICWSEPGIWQDHLFSLALQLTIPQLMHRAG